VFFYLYLAWRNIWRNKRRSIINIASVLFAVVVALGTRSMQLGTYDRMIENLVSYYTGYAQVQHKGYNDTHSLDESFVANEAFVSHLQGADRATSIAPRLEAFGLVCGDSATMGAMLVGIDPAREAEFSHLARRVKQGAYLEAASRGVLIAAGLAEQLKLGLNDTIVVLSQGYHGTTAAGKYAVEGIVDFPSPELNNRLIYLTLPTAQNLFACENRLTSLAVMVKKSKHQLEMIESVKSLIRDDLKVLSWQDLLPELLQYIQMDNASGVIWLIIIYMVIGFGILGTILMMTLERNREFGMLIAIGMKRGSIRVIVLLESVILSFIGAVAGAIVGAPILLYFFYNPIRFTGDMAQYMIQYGFEPIMPFSLEPMIFVWQTVSVLIIALVVAAYPLFKISKIDPVSALRTG